MLFRKVGKKSIRRKKHCFFFVFNKGDEVVELGGVSLRGKSAVFVENLMNTIQNEFEIIVRNQFSFVPMDNNNIQRRHSVDTSASPIVNNIMIKPKSKSIDSIEQIDKIAEEEEDKTSKTVRKSSLYF
jgi:hypothetical protein